MEYVQVVLFQIAADRIGAALRPGGLLAVLEEHREHLDAQPGFLDMRIVRSPNAEGAVQVVVETHWEDDESLVRYETQDPNVATIVGQRQDAIIPASLQVYDMEAVRAEAVREAQASRQLRERLVLPLLVPLGAFLFAVLVIFGLSRIYLEVPNEAATGLAIGIAIGILGISGFLATRPGVTRWQVAGIVGLVVALLLAGGIFTAVHEDGAEAGEAAAKETAAAATAPAAAPASSALNVEMGDNFFAFKGQRQPNIQAPAGEETTVNLVNNGKAVHDLRIAGIDGKYDTADDFVSEPETVRAGQKASLTFKIEKAGSYDFRCDFHPDEMVGTIRVQ